jgi:hypothetical protein
VRDAVAEDGGPQRLVLVRDLWEDVALYPCADRDVSSAVAVKRQAARALVRSPVAPRIALRSQEMESE